MSRNPTVRYAVPGTTIAYRAYGFNRIAVSNWHQCYSKFMARFTADQVLMRTRRACGSTRPTLG